MDVDIGYFRKKGTYFHVEINKGLGLGIGEKSTKKGQHVNYGLYRPILKNRDDFTWTKIGVRPEKIKWSYDR